MLLTTAIVTLVCVTNTNTSVLLTPVLVAGAVMRFSSCFGNQSLSHRDTRLSPHPGEVDTGIQFHAIYSFLSLLKYIKKFEDLMCDLVQWGKAGPRSD